MSPDSRDFTSYEDYIRRELPRLIRSNIEEVARRDMQPLEASLIGSLVGIIQDCHDRVFRAYRESQRVDEEIEVPPTEDLAASISPAQPGFTGDEIPDQPLDSYPQRSEFLDISQTPCISATPPCRPLRLIPIILLLTIITFLFFNCYM
jgi:hypothetical protein